MSSELAKLCAFHRAVAKARPCPGIDRLVDVWCKHRIAKVTAKTVVVPLDPCVARFEARHASETRKMRVFRRSEVDAGRVGTPGEWGEWIFDVAPPAYAAGTTVDLPAREPWELRLRGWATADAADSRADADRVVLGVGDSASVADIRRAFRKLAIELHPDRGGDAAEFRRVQEAYDRLRGGP